MYLSYIFETQERLFREMYLFHKIILKLGFSAFMCIPSSFQHPVQEREGEQQAASQIGCPTGGSWDELGWFWALMGLETFGNYKLSNPNSMKLQTFKPSRSNVVESTLRSATTKLGTLLGSTWRAIFKCSRGNRWMQTLRFCQHCLLGLQRPSMTSPRPGPMRIME